VSHFFFQNCQAPPQNQQDGMLLPFLAAKRDTKSDSRVGQLPTHPEAFLIDSIPSMMRLDQRFQTYGTNKASFSTELLDRDVSLV
jgi:hypothetical protein